MTTTASALDAVRDLAPSIRARGDEFEAARALTPDVFEQLKAAGVWRFLTPRSHGGLESGLVPSMQLLEELALADTSVAWATMIGIETPQILALLPRTVYDELYARGPDLTCGGGFMPIGKAHAVAGGYQASGRWPFVSGCERWDLLFANCVVHDDGKPRMQPSGEPVVRCVVLPASKVRIEDTWRTLGMRGTGSHHITIEEAFIPEGHVFDLFGGTTCVEGVSRFPIIDFNLHIVVIVLGLARSALEEVVTTAKSKQRMNTRATLARTPLIQYRLGRAQTALRAARAYLYAEAERTAAVMAAGTEDFLTLAVRSWANHAWIADLCEEVVDTCFNTSGTSGIYDGSRLQRLLRDMHTIRQHMSLNDNSITRAGAALLGEPVSMNF